jgi:hypothetical protein
MQGRRVALPADVVAVIDEKGQENETIRTLPEGPMTPDVAEMTDGLFAAKKDEWQMLLEPLSKSATSGLLDAMVARSGDAKAETRLRAIHVLARLCTRESVAAATTALLAEKDAATRRAAASALFAVE